MNSVPLADLLLVVRNGLNAVQYDKQLNNDMLPITRIETISYGTIDFKRVKYTKVSETEREKYQLIHGDILFSHINSPEHIGKTAIYQSDKELIHGINLLVLRPNQRVCYPGYLNYYLKTFNVRSMFRARCKKAVNQASLNHDDVLGLTVPILPLPEQKRIATILEKADRLRRLRRYALELSRTYLQSVFLEMFGDPETNPMGWDKKELQELITPSRPITYGILKPGPNIPNGVPYIRVIDIQNNTIVLPGIRKTSPKIAEEYKRSKLQGGDLLLSIRGHVGRMAVVPDSLSGANITQDTARLATYEPSDAWFLLGYLSTTVMKTYMANFTRGAAVQGINLGDVKEIPVIVPPVGERQKYSCVVRKIERLQLQQAEAERQAEHLFQTLLHKAFQGELSLNEDEMLMPDVEVFKRKMPAFADVIEPISRDAYQMALPLE